MSVSITSEKVKVKVSVAEISVEPSTSVQAIESRVGLIISRAVKVALAAVIALSKASSTVAPMAT